MHPRGIGPLPAVHEATECCCSLELVERCYAMSLCVNHDMNEKRGTLWVVVRLRGAGNEYQRLHDV
jgi:hypothetical protein